MKSLKLSLVFGILAALVTACGAADAGDIGSEEPTDEVQQELPKGWGSSGGSCTIEKCNGVLDPFGHLECIAGGFICTCVHGTTRGSCAPGNASDCHETCVSTKTAN
jgi:hypothetical protein